MLKMLKYPRTPHIQGSRIQPGDEDLSQIPFRVIAGRSIVVEEKCDGANSAVSFDADGALLLQSRGHYLTGGAREKHYDLLKKWASVHQRAFRSVLGSRYVMYGEWMYAKHAIYYDALPHYFLEFDVFDRERGAFLDTSARRALLASLPVVSAPVIAKRAFNSLDELKSLVGGMLVRADILGRTAGDIGRLLDELALFTATAKELGCLDGPPRFADPFSRLAWLEGRTEYPEQKLYNDTWGRVYMMCALPGTGKDTWIRSNLPDVPMVSLDAIRAELGVSWEDGQGPVVARAFERAREHLRAHRSFVWNATCLTPDFRRREIQLFRDYGAYTEIVVLEVPWEEGLRRNRNRKAWCPMT